MDLKQFILNHKRNGTLDAIIDGFEKSSFVEPNSDTSVLVKTILNVLISNEDGDKQKIYNQLNHLVLDRMEIKILLQKSLVQYFHKTTLMMK